MVASEKRFLRIFGNRLSEARQRAGLSQAALGQAIGRTAGAIYKAEREDVAQMYLSVLPKLAAALRMTPEQVRIELCPPEFPALSAVNRGLWVQLRELAAQLAKEEGVEIEEIFRRVGELRHETERQAPPSPGDNPSEGGHEVEFLHGGLGARIKRESTRATESGEHQNNLKSAPSGPGRMDVPPAQQEGELKAGHGERRKRP